MDRKTFAKTCRRRGYGNAAQISAWMRFHRKAEYTEEDCIALYEWCDRIDWRTMVYPEPEKEDEDE